MSRSCHSATFSTAALGVAAQDPRKPGDALGRDRVALVGHRARALLAGAEGLLDLADLGALEVADLRGEALQAGAGERDRLQQLGVAVAGDDLCGDRLAFQAQAGQHALLELRRGCGVGADGAGDRAHRDLVEGALQPRDVARRLHREARELDAERRRLGVHAVRATDADGVHVLARASSREHRDELARPGQDDLAGGA